MRARVADLTAIAGVLLLNLFVEWMNIPAEIAFAFVIVITIPLTFMMSRIIIKSGLTDDV